MKIFVQNFLMSLSPLFSFPLFLAGEWPGEPELLARQGSLRLDSTSSFPFSTAQQAWVFEPVWLYWAPDESPQEELGLGLVLRQQAAWSSELQVLPQ